MLIRWSELNPGDERTELVLSEATRVAQAIPKSESELNARLAAVDQRLSARRQGDGWALLYDDIEALPLAEKIAEHGELFQVGRCQTGHERALFVAKKETGVDLSASQVRAGFSRGHLLELVVSVPLDVEADAETLQVASEIYLEERLGDVLMDIWVSNVSVSRIARRKGLTMVPDERESSETHPLSEIVLMVERGQRIVWEQLPASMLVTNDDEEEWTALDIPPSTRGLQPHRRFASTRSPEALKAALEGLPFSSERFTTGPEVFCFFSWCAEVSMIERIALRVELEEMVRAWGAGIALAGTGFGVERDYLDVWSLPDSQLLRAIGRRIASRVDSCELGFYDSKWGQEQVRFSESS